MKPNSSFPGRICQVCFVVSLLLVLSALPVVADDANSQYVNTTGVSQNQLNFVVTGDHTADFTATVNPFGTFGTNNAVTYTYNATLDQTTISFAGPNSVAAGASAYAGLDASGFSDQIAYAYWGMPQSSPPSSLGLPAPSWSVSNPGSGPNSIFIILYATIELSNGQSVSSWDEQQVPANQPFMVGLGNNDTLNGNQFAFNVGFQFSNTEIPLDDLNLTDYPPPGQTGSMFNPLPGIPNDSEIPSGGSLESGEIDTPEPSMIALFSCGALGLLGHWRLAAKRKK